MVGGCARYSMRVCCCCCAAACLLCPVAACCVCRWAALWGGVLCVVVGFAFLGRTDVRTDACVGRMSEQKRSLWAATGLSAGPLTRVLGACLCVCPQEPAGWPGCGYMRRWVSLDPCFACAWRVGVCVCVWLGVLCCACWLLAALVGRSCVRRLCRPRDLSRAQGGHEGPCVLCVCGLRVPVPPPPPSATAAPAAALWPYDFVDLAKEEKREGKGRRGLAPSWSVVEARWLFQLFVFGSCLVGGGLICSAGCSLSLFGEVVSCSLD